MNKYRNLIKRNSKKLRNSNRKLEDIYSAIFDTFADRTMIECSTMTRKVTFTYRQIDQAINSAANAVAERTKQSNCYIGLHGDNSLEWIIAFWAILKSGNKPYLINLRQPQSFSERILSALDAKFVITCNSETVYNITTIKYESLSTDSDSDSNSINAVFANEFALSTSGTTLKEKICIYNGETLSEQILNTDLIVDQNPNIVGTRNGCIKMLAFLPMYHIFGLEAMFLWFAFFGSAFVFLNDLAPETILRTIRNHNVTHVFSVPLLWHAIEKSVRKELSHKDEKTRKKFENASRISLRLQNTFPRLGPKIASKIFKDVRNRLLGENIRFCISGGSFIKPSAMELLNILGYPLCNGYGMTEIGICSVELGKKPKERMLCSIGKPFASLEYKIGPKNQLLVKGNSICKNMIVDGVEHENSQWFDTGDIVHFDDSGRYYIDGRFSDVVFSDDGENLNPDFAEQAFSIRDAVEFCVIGNSDNTKLSLIVRIPKDLFGDQKTKILEDIAQCNSKLPPSYNVRDIKFTFDPLIESGGIKISRAYVKKSIAENKIKLFEPHDENAFGIHDNDSAIKTIIREMFAKILEIPVEKIDDNKHFMNDLGGTSLDYFTLISEIDTRFDLRIDFGNEYSAEKYGYTVNHFEKMIKELIK